jgi:RHS repeat-associated protein
VRDVVNTSGTVIDHVAYNGYGTVTSETSSANGDRFKFAGREFDAAINLYYNRRRYYDAVTGRFISEDPSGFTAGDANLDRYVGNGPTDGRDPSGLDGNTVSTGVAVDPERQALIAWLQGGGSGPNSGSSPVFDPSIPWQPTFPYDQFIPQPVNKGYPGTRYENSYNCLGTPFHNPGDGLTDEAKVSVGGVGKFGLASVGLLTAPLLATPVAVFLGLRALDEGIAGLREAFTGKPTDSFTHQLVDGGLQYSGLTEAESGPITNFLVAFADAGAVLRTIVRSAAGTRWPGISEPAPLPFESRISPRVVQPTKYLTKLEEAVIGGECPKGVAPKATPRLSPKARDLLDGNDVKVKSIQEADALLKEALPGARKVTGTGPGQSGPPDWTKFKGKDPNGIYHKDYQFNPETGRIYGHGPGNQHGDFKHINVKLPDGSKVTIGIEPN